MYLHCLLRRVGGLAGLHAGLVLRRSVGLVSVHVVRVGLFCGHIMNAIVVGAIFLLVAAGCKLLLG